MPWGPQGWTGAGRPGHAGLKGQGQDFTQRELGSLERPRNRGGMVFPQLSFGGCAVSRGGGRERWVPLSWW